MSRRKKKVKWDKNLNPCPFCNSDEVRVIYGIGAGTEQPMGICNKCGVTVSFYEANTYIEFMGAWNRTKGN